MTNLTPHGADPALRAPRDYAYDFLVFIGRFQPFHAGHKRVLDAALSQGRRVIVLTGSARQPRSIRNPWTWEERAEMIRGSYDADEAERILVAPLLDTPYHDQSWIGRVQATVQGLVCQYQTEPPRIALIGHAKDRTSYYLKMFPQWDAIDVPQDAVMDATTLRRALFGALAMEEGAGADGARGAMDALAEAGDVPDATTRVLARFVHTEAARDVLEEHRATESYKAAWAEAPYPPIFVTVDAVVVQAGHVLLVRRGGHPGRGQLALPGGFLDPDERIADAMIRELREETRIGVPAPVLRGSIRRSRVFDDPHRSSRGRTVSHGYLVELSGEPGALAKVRGGDDAAHAGWHPLASIDPAEMFEDHYHIIQTLLERS